MYNSFETPVMVKTRLKLWGQEVAETKPRGMEGSTIDCAISIVSYVSKTDIPNSMTLAINILFYVLVLLSTVLIISHIDNTGRSKAYRNHCYN